LNKHQATSNKASNKQQEKEKEINMIKQELVPGAPQRAACSDSGQVLLAAAGAGGCFTASINKALFTCTGFWGYCKHRKPPPTWQKPIPYLARRKHSLSFRC
jgi:hypothetical protein